MQLYKSKSNIIKDEEFDLKELKEMVISNQLMLGNKL